MSAATPITDQLKRILHDGEKHDPRVVFDVLRKMNKTRDNGDIREAIYALMDRREIELTPDRFLRLVK